ncbi:uncharacterized protein A4U43_C03F21830 [Asparagus officinalis]|uniref:Uncharacterized protein n=1 Tax=Asparagus officinalis TaxID=4686 RepID=A0A5P1FC05_ASPOF|nr:uncharacterized protein A4U43_C03F21830 [Asparagus officinalis]
MEVKEKMIKDLKASDIQKCTETNKLKHELEESNKMVRRLFEELSLGLQEKDHIERQGMGLDVNASGAEDYESEANEAPVEGAEVGVAGSTMDVGEGSTKKSNEANWEARGRYQKALMTSLNSMHHYRFFFERSGVE